MSKHSNEQPLKMQAHTATQNAAARTLLYGDATVDTKQLDCVRQNC